MDRQPLRYRVDLGAVSATVPWLLKSFATWLSTQPYGSVGCFAIQASVPANENVLVFATLPNDRELAIDAATGAVFMRWAGGGVKRELARSLAAFLVALSESELGVIALDAGHSTARAELATWLRLGHHAGPRASSAKLKLDTEPNQTAR